ncbi:NAD(P)H-dependent oxidoreductase [Streptomyces sp. NPDC005728]
MPLYDGDVETAEGLPSGTLALRDRLEQSDAFVISAPEYNSWPTRGASRR